MNKWQKLLANPYIPQKCDFCNADSSILFDGGGNSMICLDCAHKQREDEIEADRRRNAGVLP
jgi:glutaredoxin